MNDGTLWYYFNFAEMPPDLAKLMLIIYGSIAVFLLIMGICTAIVASKKGRNGFGWFFIGFFTTFVGLAISLAILPRKYYIEDDEEE